MSAYQDLMTALATRSPDQSAAEDERIVLAALATHAHELAERQRAYAKEAGMPLEDGPYVSLGDVIDLIDPHVGAELVTLAVTDNGLCRATLQGWPREVVVDCAREAGHYDETQEPDFSGDEPKPGGWHQSVPDEDGNRRTWADRSDGATPHSERPVSSEGTDA